MWCHIENTAKEEKEKEKEEEKATVARNENNNNDNSNDNSNENENSENSNNKYQSKNTFQNTLNALEGKFGARQLGNISVQFTFIALLHLANEKNLQFVAQNETDLADFYIKVRLICGFVDIVFWVCIECRFEMFCCCCCCCCCGCCCVMNSLQIQIVWKRDKQLM